MSGVAIPCSCKGKSFFSYLALSHCVAEITHSITSRCYSSYRSNTPISIKGRVFREFENVKCLDDALIVFRQMVREKPLPSPISFSKLLNTMVNMKHYSAVVSLFKEMHNLRIPVEGSILNIVINSYCLLHCADLGFSVLSIFFKSGIPFNVVTFTTLIKGLFAQDKVKDAIELFKKLVRENSCVVDEVMYGTIMNGLSKRGHTQKAFDLLHVMEHGRIKPNTCNYNIVIDALSRDGMLNDATSLFNEMKQKGTPPDIVTYSSLIDGLCKYGQWENIKVLFCEMVNHNVYPNVRTFSMVIDGLCKEGKVEEADEIMRDMIEKGVEPNVVTYNVIMDGYCLRGEMGRARRIFDCMIDKSIVPNIFNYNVLMNGYCKKKKLDEAMQLFLEISRKGLKPNVVTYSTILQGLFEVGRMDVVEKFYSEMLSEGHKPDLCTHRILLVGYFKNGLVEKAMSLFYELERNREDIGIKFYNIVIDRLCKNGKFYEAHAIFEMLSFKGLHPDVITYTTMINGFCWEGLLDEAKDMLRKMEDIGCFPNNATYNVIVQGFLRCKKGSEMKTFLKEVTGKAFSFDATTTELLINAIAEDPSLLDVIPKFHLENKNLKEAQGHLQLRKSPAALYLNKEDAEDTFGNKRPPLMYSSSVAKTEFVRHKDLTAVGDHFQDCTEKVHYFRVW